MHRIARALSRSLVPGVLVGVFASMLAVAPTWAQTGTVLSFVKQSDSTGTFTAPLRNFDEFGGEAVGLGDLDGPGPSTYAMAVGAALDDDGGLNRGAVYILFMGSAGDVLSHQKISSLSGGLIGPLLLGDEFGSSVAFLGDLDGNGPSAAALAVGAPFRDDGGTSKGAIWILFLSTTGTVIAEQKISSTTGGFTGLLDAIDEFGGSLGWLGDLDLGGPSATALAVGAGGDDDGGGDRGAVWVLFLDRTGIVLSHQKISSTVGGFAGPLDNADDFGTSLAEIGDLDGAGPGVRSLAVGASFDDDGGIDRGAVYVLTLASTGLVLAQQKISSTTGGLPAVLGNLDEFGGPIEHLGDMDGAGPAVTSIGVGATGDDDGGLDRGALYLLHLSSAGTVVSSSKISDTEGNFGGILDNEDGFGSSIALLGDLDGAGPAGVTLAIGTPGDDDFGFDRGALYILFLDGVPTTDVPQLPVTSALGALGRTKPNPFHLRTTIEYRLGVAGDARIEITDVGGRRVRVFDARPSGPGQYGFDWDGSDDDGRSLPAGTYFYRMLVNGRAVAATEKAILLR